MFDDIWGIPPYEDNISGGQISAKLRDNRYFKRMGDCEIVLRFFAFRRKSKLRGAVKKILDDCMRDYRDIEEDTLADLRGLFLNRLEVAAKIFGGETFCIRHKGKMRRSEPLYDAIMVAIDNMYDARVALIKNGKAIKDQLYETLENDEEVYDLVVGRPNTAQAIKDRQDLVQGLLNEYI